VLLNKNILAISKKRNTIQTITDKELIELETPRKIHFERIEKEDFYGVESCEINRLV
jgi:hypothetical protein